MDQHGQKLAQADKPGRASPPLIVGNWKMNGVKAALGEAILVRDGMIEARGEGAVLGSDVIICPPATLIMVLGEVLKGSSIKVGGQDCHAAVAGAFTGDVSASMLADAGATAVILGHCERRGRHGERDRDVAAKVSAAHAAGLLAIVCVGETAGERAAGLTNHVVERQLRGSLPSGVTAQNTVIAYEPIWAIGTGLTPTASDIADVHTGIKAALETLDQPATNIDADARGVRILYGGSVTPTNADEFLRIPNVYGALVGGASLRSADLLAIIGAGDKIPAGHGA